MSTDIDRFLANAFACLDPMREKVALANAHRFRSGDTARLGFVPHRWVAGECQRPLGQYYNCTTFRPDAERALGAEAVRTHVVVFDDVGDHARSKASIDPLLALARPPHAVIATRRDGEGHTNNQAVYFIEPHKPEAARILVKAAAEVGWCDPGCSGGVRWARPPGSIKATGEPFAAELAVDNLANPWITLDDLAVLLGIEEIARRLIEEHKNARRRDARETRASHAEVQGMSDNWEKLEEFEDRFEEALPWTMLDEHVKFVVVTRSRSQRSILAPVLPGTHPTLARTICLPRWCSLDSLRRRQVNQARRLLGGQP